MSLANTIAKASYTGNGHGPGMYMGDPGLFGDIWKGIRKVGGIATGIVGGLGIPVVSGVARTVGGALFGPPGIQRYTGPMIPSFAPTPGTTTYAQGPRGVPVGIASSFGARPGLAGFQMVPTPGFGGAVERFLPGGATGFQQAGPPMSGYHWNKSGYFLRDGTFVAPGTKMVRNRRRNPGNMRALSRSLGRIKSAKKMAATLSSVTIRKTC